MLWVTALLAAIETGWPAVKAAKQVTPRRSRTWAVHPFLSWKDGDGFREYWFNAERASSISSPWINQMVGSSIGTPLSPAVKGSLYGPATFSLGQCTFLKAGIIFGIC